MAFSDQLTSEVADRQSSTKMEVAKHRSNDLAKASMAMCALNAAATAALSREANDVAVRRRPGPSPR